MKIYLIIFGFMCLSLESEAAPFETESTHKDLYEGDMILTRGQRNYLFGDDGGRKGRLATMSINSIWPKTGDKVFIPYEIKPEYSDNYLQSINRSIHEINTKTCVKLIPRTNEVDYLYISKGTSRGCWSYVGKTGGMQDVNIGDDCYTAYVILHELLHALGFFHMHNHWERDRKIVVNYDNIIPDARATFAKEKTRDRYLFNTPYDMVSIMHYHSWAHSSGQRVMTSINPDDQDKLYNPYALLSMGDIIRINTMHQCW